MAENTEAPRAYFPYPSELDTLPENTSLPDLFEFFDASADPDGSGRVETPEQWEARRSELKDLLQYYLYGSRLDPLKSDTVVTGVFENYAYNWAEGVMTSPPGYFGYASLPNLPEGAVTYTPLDFSAWGMGMFYSNITPDENFVYHGDEFVVTESLKSWTEGDTWEEHTDAVTRVTLPTVTVQMTIRDTTPANAAYVSEAAKEGITVTFNIRFPQEAPVVDGQVRDAHSSKSGKGYPVLVGTGSISEAQIVTLNNNGYVFIAAGDSADPDSGQLSAYEKLYPPTDPVVHNDNTIVNEYMLDSGDLMHTGWFISRALDAIENYMLLSDEEKAALNPNVIIPDIDVYASAVTGCSQGGKRAMVAGVFDTGDNGDTRFDIICPSDPGAGGATGYRYATEGQLFSYEPPYQGTTVHNYPYGLNETTQRAIQNTGEDQWFLDRAQILTVRPDLADNMPIDAHSFIAAFATAKEDRYFLVWTGEGQDAWLNSPATVLNTWAAREAFEFLGQGDNIAVIVRDQAHANQDRDIADLIGLMDHLYYGAEKIVRKYHATLTSNGLLANDGNGAIMPDQAFDSIREMERNPYYIPSTYLNWSRPDKHVLWTASNSVTEGVPMTFEFHTDAQKVELLLTDGETVLEAEAADGIATIDLSAEQAKAGRYMATAIGDKDSKSIEICGWTVKDALRHAISDNSALGHDAGSGICFTTPLVNYNSTEDPVKLYLNGEEVHADLYDYDNKIYLENGEVIPQSGYLQPYGATLTLYAGTMGYNVPMGDTVVYSMRNAKIEALQGYILSLDIELQKYEPSPGRMRFKTTYNTVSTQTPVWEPELRQNTPLLGLPKGEDRWPILGNWAWDFDETGNLKPLDEIRPLTTPKQESAYKAEITLAAADTNGFTIAFSEPVNPNDFALAVNTVTGYTYTWDEGNQTVTVTYDSPVAPGTEVSTFVFRSVDLNGNMIGGPVELKAVAE
ncbi:MAG: hypothetical protein IK127_07285 [Clostridia bacterium]|nr:hypothetical protein [Clostridia bacterium]